MPLPRHLKAINHNTKRNKNRLLIQKKKEIKHICEKHNIGKLTFRSCKLVTFDGQVTFIENDEIDGNLKMGIFVIKALSLLPSGNNKIYDIIEIEKNKLERDIKKKKEEEEKTREELDRIKKNEARSEELINKEHDKISKELSGPLESTTIEPSNLNKNEPLVSTSIDPNVKNIKENEISNIIQPEQNNNTNNLKTKQDKTNNQSENIHKTKEGNKYFRRFMQDIRSCYHLVQKTEYRFVEFKAETTDMVIENVKIYEINMPNGTKEKYFLVIGDLQMKTGLIKQKDPSYEFEDVITDQYEFLERIQSKENSKTIELSEEVDDELDSSEEPKIKVPETIDLNNDILIDNSSLSNNITDNEDNKYEQEMTVGGKKIADYITDAMKITYAHNVEENN